MSLPVISLLYENGLSEISAPENNQELIQLRKKAKELEKIINRVNRKEL
ncbi:2717_t:CDS:2 [Entrophospora sp. SA101]|nr:2717_t:CDS:2 [Entrophospora sp. SA101]